MAVSEGIWHLFEILYMHRFNTHVQDIPEMETEAVKRMKCFLTSIRPSFLFE